MPRTVDEIMNRELLAVQPDTQARELRELIRSFHVGAVPVLDDAGRPLGVVSMRDLLETEGAAADRMTKPAMCVATSATIDKAARQLAATDRHHLVVVDGAGVAVGMLSTLDLLRGVLGMPTRHPNAFPHWDEATQVSWSDDWPLDEQGCASAPDAPGFVLVVRGGPGERDSVIWTEPCSSIRARATELVSKPSARPAPLASYPSQSGLRFRAAVVFDELARQRIAALLQDRLDHVPPEGGT
jgi:CBS domain protein